MYGEDSRSLRQPQRVGEQIAEAIAREQSASKNAFARLYAGKCQPDVPGMRGTRPTRSPWALSPPYPPTGSPTPPSSFAAGCPPCMIEAPHPAGHQGPDHPDCPKGFFGRAPAGRSPPRRPVRRTASRRCPEPGRKPAPSGSGRWDFLHAGTALPSPAHGSRRTPIRRKPPPAECFALLLQQRHGCSMVGMAAWAPWAVVLRAPTALASTMASPVPSPWPRPRPAPR